MLKIIFSFTHFIMCAFCRRRNLCVTALRKDIKFNVRFLSGVELFLYSRRL
jgi:hypothetical protein